MSLLLPPVSFNQAPNQAPAPPAPPAPDAPLVYMSCQEFKVLLTQAVDEALSRREQVLLDEQRLPSREAAAFLNCQPHHLQRLHRRGLNYEKGKPNMYRLADLKAIREKHRLDRSL